MVRVQKIRVDGIDPSWTLLGSDHLPITVVEMFLEHLRQTGSSPNTIKSYARVLQLWWEFLSLREKAWNLFNLEDMTAFLGWLRTGLPPGVVAIGHTAAQVVDATARFATTGCSFAPTNSSKSLEIWLS